MTSATDSAERQSPTTQAVHALIRLRNPIAEGPDTRYCERCGSRICGAYPFPHDDACPTVQDPDPSGYMSERRRKSLARLALDRYCDRCGAQVGGSRVDPHDDACPVAPKTAPAVPGLQLG